MVINAYNSHVPSTFHSIVLWCSFPFSVWPAHKSFSRPFEAAFRRTTDPETQCLRWETHICPDRNSPSANPPESSSRSVVDGFSCTFRSRREYSIFSVLRRRKPTSLNLYLLNFWQGKCNAIIGSLVIGCCTAHDQQALHGPYYSERRMSENYGPTVLDGLDWYVFSASDCSLIFVQATNAIRLCRVRLGLMWLWHWPDRADAGCFAMEMRQRARQYVVRV